VPEENDSEEVKHEKFEEIKMWVTLNVPVYLVGPAGSGKNHTLEQVAKELNLDFYFTNSIQQEYKLTGFISPKLSGEDVYVETEFYKAFTKGGLFFLDELDASIPEVLVLLNAAIANGYFEFQGKGRIDAHENFRVVAAGNTFGNGADEQYTGRLTLDQATLDRFAVVEFGYSLKIEMLLAKGNTELVDFVHELRKQAEEKGIRATFSYRCISMITKAEGKIPLEVILKSAVFKGLDKDTMGTLKPFAIGNNKYFSAMCKIS
jgi:MoxR-like ATPase